MAEATKLAHELAHGPASLGMIRKLMWRALDSEFGAQLDDEADTQTLAGQTKDFLEGVQAFLQKRPAQFTGQ
jgi:2-(1,2-epoxy-1,2-dihydrophenyl)acetyl-CoA isomerase